MTRERIILGVTFFSGTALEAVRGMRAGGLLVVPAAPALINLQGDRGYRESLTQATIVLPDSSLMVRTWNLLQHDRLLRISGLEYLRTLLRDSAFQCAADTLWIVPNTTAREKHLRYLAESGMAVSPEFVYLAPTYSAPDDMELLEIARQLRPTNIVITLGGGIQEQLGLFLERNLAHRPAIHCIGAALSFESGDQVAISPFADAMGLGWLLRCLSNPKIYVGRYLRAFRLVPLLFRYRAGMPG